MAAHIASIPLFEGLPKTQRQELGGIAVERVFRNGQASLSAYLLYLSEMNRGLHDLE